MIYNLSIGKKALSQRDNLVRPHETCNPTAIAMMLTYSGITLPAYTGQLEDTLTKFANNDPRVINFYQNNMQKWIRDLYKQGRPANEIHAVMEYAVNTWYGKDIISFTTTGSIQKIIKSLLDNKPVVLSGEFPYKYKSGVIKNIGHMVCCVGFETEQDLSDSPRLYDLDITKIKNIILDDPYGNYHTMYADINGNDIQMPYADFLSKIREKNSISKWCYFLV